MADEHILVLVSGGKDSLACLLLAIDQYPKSRIVPLFCDTGWEHPVTYEYLEYLEQKLAISIRRTNGARLRNGTFVDSIPSLIRAYGKFPSNSTRFCTKTLKTRASARYFSDQLFDGRTMYHFWFGMRTDESESRRRKYNDITSDDLFDIDDIANHEYSMRLRTKIKARLPIVDWSTEEVLYYVESKGVELNPLYAEGTNDRVGCYPCMLAGRKTQEKMFNTQFGRQRLYEIKQLELEIGKKYEMHDTNQNSCGMCNL